MKTGDKVIITKGKEWSEYLGKIGVIKKDYRDGDFAVNLGGYNTISITGNQLIKVQRNDS